MQHDKDYLRDLLKLCEASPQYRDGPHWAVATVCRLRDELRRAEEYAAGVAVLVETSRYKSSERSEPALLRPALSHSALAGPYPSCRTPIECNAFGYCRRDPACNE